MKNGLRLIVIVLKTAVAAYLIGCVGLSWLQQLRQNLEKFGRMQSKEHRNGETESETRNPIRVIRRYAATRRGLVFANFLSGLQMHEAPIDPGKRRTARRGHERRFLLRASARALCPFVRQSGSPWRK